MRGCRGRGCLHMCSSASRSVSPQASEVPTLQEDSAEEVMLKVQQYTAVGVRDEAMCDYSLCTPTYSGSRKPHKRRTKPKNQTSHPQGEQKYFVFHPHGKHRVQEKQSRGTPVVATAVSGLSPTLTPRSLRCRTTPKKTQVAAHTHYMPEHWLGKAHTAEVRTELLGLFRYKAQLFLEVCLLACLFFCLSVCRSVGQRRGCFPLVRPHVWLRHALSPVERG